MYHVKKVKKKRLRLLRLRKKNGCLWFFWWDRVRSDKKSKDQGKKLLQIFLNKSKCTFKQVESCETGVSLLSTQGSALSYLQKKWLKLFLKNTLPPGTIISEVRAYPLDKHPGSLKGRRINGPCSPRSRTNKMTWYPKSEHTTVYY